MPLVSPVRATRLFLMFLSAIAAFAGAPAMAAAPLRVVVTILPLHGLVSAVTQGTGVKPALLIPGGLSPHTFSLRPSDARLLARADVVFRVGEGLETGLDRAIGVLAPSARIVELGDAPGVRHRQWAGDGDADGDGQAHDHDHVVGAVDPHVWLNPENAAAMADAAAETLAAADPARAAAFRANAAALQVRLKKLDAALKAILAPVRRAPFIVFHDAYGYFEDHYGLSGAGWVAAAPDRRPGVAHLSALVAAMKRDGVRCVFTEPQFTPRQAKLLARDGGARLGVLDPLGADVTPGPQAYETVLRQLAAGFVGCLAGGSGVSH